MQKEKAIVNKVPRFGIFNNNKVSRPKIGEDLDLELFTKEVDEKGRIHFPMVKETVGRVKRVVDIEGNMFVVTTYNSFYICCNSNECIYNYNFVSINTKPKKEKVTEVIGTVFFNEDYLYKFSFVPDEINTKYARFGLYILKHGLYYYLCVMR